MLYHVSTDTSGKEKLFIPGVPNFRLDGEDSHTKRVCVSNNIRNCISSFPYKNTIMWSWRCGKPTYLAVYSVDETSFSKEEIKSPEEIADKVADALQNQEYWVLKEFTTTPTLIKIKNLNFSRLCKYTNHYSGEVTELEYEENIEDKDRVEKAMFYHKKHYKEFLKICAKQGIKIQEDNARKENMDYFGCIPSTREYTVHRVTYMIPAGVSALPIWNVIQKELYKNKRKHLVYINGDFS